MQNQPPDTDSDSQPATKPTAARKLINILLGIIAIDIVIIVVKNFL